MIVTGDTTKNLEDALKHSSIQESLGRIREEEDNKAIEGNLYLLTQKRLEDYLDDQCVRFAKGVNGLHIAGKIKIQYDNLGRITGMAYLNSKKIPKYSEGKAKIFVYDGSCLILGIEFDSKTSERAKRVLGASAKMFNENNY